MRPIYETQFDLARENEVKDTLKVMWGVEFNKLPIAYHVDWMVTRNGEAKAFAELKCRNNPRRQYPTLMLSLHKWMHGKDLAKEIGYAPKTLVCALRGKQRAGYDLAKILAEKTGMSPLYFMEGDHGEK